MYLIEVIPLARLPRTLPETFTYFSGTELLRGTVVQMTVQRRRLFGIVISALAVRDAKQHLRSAPFILKKIDRVVSEKPVFNQRDWKFLDWIREFYLAQSAAAARLLIPPFVQNQRTMGSWEARLDALTLLAKELRVLVAPESFSYYEKAVVIALERNEQVLIVAPTRARSQALFQALKDAVPGPILLHVTSTEPAKSLKQIWHRVRRGETLIAVGTRLSLFLPFCRLGLIIVDDDGSPAHKSWEGEPRYHARDVAKALHELHGGTLILAGGPPSLEAYAAANTESPGTSLTIFPERSPAPLSLFVDMQREIKEEGRFVVLSQVLRDKLRSLLQDNGRALLFVNRKGFAPFILCQQCGYSIRCTNCSVPLVYHVQESLAESTLLCHHCGAKQGAPDVCPHCGSHRLKAYGIGIERAMRELRKFFPEITIIPLSAGEPKRAGHLELLLERLRGTPTYVAVGTEFILSGLPLPIMDLTAIITIDTALSLPDFLQDERLFRVLALTRRLAKKTFILQSFSKEPELLKDLFHGSFKHFAEKELKERRRFGYPPYGELIKLTIADRKREEALRAIRNLYRDVSLMIERIGRTAVEVTNPYPAYIEKKKGYFVFHILIKIMDRDRSPDTKVLLRELLPPGTAVDVNPITLL